jgi:myo-inositol-1(or 4)-monophosphatase
MPPLPADAPEILARLRQLTAEVGGEMIRLADDLRAQTAKGGGHDVVTRADRFSEDRLTAALATWFPTHRIAGEEGTVLGPAGSEWTWHIDPLDGTCNYSRGIPCWGISIGLAFQREPVLGIIHAPAYGVTLTGAVGLGAWNHDQALARATPAGPEKTWVVATDWPWPLEQRARTTRFISFLEHRVRQYKTMGSAAIDLANLALGRVDAYAISHIFPWDQAGGCACVRALGYELLGWDGTPWDLGRPDILACRPGMEQILLQGLAANG